MKKTLRPLLLLFLVGSITPRLSAASFNSGSDGSYGAIDITSSKTLEMPPDGVFNCTTITIGCNATLSFKPNPLNTPVYLLATGDVTISGYISVSGVDASGGLGGLGGPGGFGGGMGGITGGHSQGGDGAGPGGGKATAGWFGGVFGFPFRSNTNVYGNALLYPLIGGSGGAGTGSGGGGGGGGAILIASNTRIVFDYCFYGEGVYALGGIGNGNDSTGGAGNGGAIRLVAPTIGGSGALNTTSQSDFYGLGGSQGRIRIDCTDDYAYRTLNYYGSFSRGSQMWVFQTNSPKLDITAAAGQAIPVGTASAVTVSLPFGAPTNQVVSLSAQNFTNDVPVRIAVTPDTGPSANFDGVIKNTGNPSTGTFNVVIPAGTISRVYAWTR